MVVKLHIDVVVNKVHLLQSDTQLHTGILFHTVSQECRESIVAALVDRLVVSGHTMLIFSPESISTKFFNVIVILQVEFKLLLLNWIYCVLLAAFIVYPKNVYTCHDVLC